jgi:uncharacterized membrane protein YphA (DoxX/SURF4 family)
MAGVIFFFAGLVKFVFHHWELHAFRSFGLPFPSVLEIFARVVETVGGVLLALPRCVALVAAVLGVTMLVAIGSSGIGDGDVVPSLTLAPVLLIAMLYLLRTVCRKSTRHDLRSDDRGTGSGRPRPQPNPCSRSHQIRAPRPGSAHPLPALPRIARRLLLSVDSARTSRLWNRVRASARSWRWIAGSSFVLKGAWWRARLLRRESARLERCVDCVD